MELLENLKSKATKVHQFLSKTVVILISLIIGFLVSEGYQVYLSKVAKSDPKMSRTLTQKEISVAINERGELIFMNRIDGTYIIYSDSVGLIVFNHYASKMYFKAAETTLPSIK